jgi:hypothetical protein
VATKRSDLRRWMLATGLVLALSSVAVAQTVGAVSEGGLQPSWSDSAMAGGWRAVCGDVRNVGRVPARSVAIRVQGLGSTGQVSSRSSLWRAVKCREGLRQFEANLRANSKIRGGPEKYRQLLLEGPVPGGPGRA